MTAHDLILIQEFIVHAERLRYDVMYKDHPEACDCYDRGLKGLLAAVGVQWDRGHSQPDFLLAEIRP